MIPHFFVKERECVTAEPAHCCICDVSGRVKGSDIQQWRTVGRDLFLLWIGNDEVLYRYLILTLKEASDPIQVENGG